MPAFNVPESEDGLGLNLFEKKFACRMLLHLCAFFGGSIKGNECRFQDGIISTNHEHFKAHISHVIPLLVEMLFVLRRHAESILQFVW